MNLTTECIDQIAEGLSEEDKQLIKSLGDNPELPPDHPIMKEAQAILKTKIASGLMVLSDALLHILPLGIVLQGVTVSALRYGVRIGYAAAFDEMMKLEDDRPAVQPAQEENQ